MQRLVLNKHNYETIGTFSIQGRANDLGFTIDKPLVIVFQVCTLAYCREHDGPEFVMMPDYVPFCIMESIIEMIKNGWNLSVEQERTTLFSDK